MYKNSLNFSVTGCFLYTVSTDAVHTAKALKMQFKQLQFQNITYSPGHSDAFLCCCITFTDFKTQYDYTRNRDMAFQKLSRANRL